MTTILSLIDAIPTVGAAGDRMVGASSAEVMAYASAADRWRIAGLRLTAARASFEHEMNRPVSPKILALKSTQRIRGVVTQKLQDAETELVEAEWTVLQAWETACCADPEQAAMARQRALASDLSRMSISPRIMTEVGLMLLSMGLTPLRQ